MFDVSSVPELAALDRRRGLVRLPGEMDVPVTPRIRRLIDSPPFRRLARISQLGLVSLVYPGATHSRFEHSLGAFYNALLFVRRLATTDEFGELVSPAGAEALLVAALLHDVGHWPYCHPLEDMQLPEIPRHEQLALERLRDPSITEVLGDSFSCTADDIAALVSGESRDGTPGDRLRSAVLSGPIDVDKMDYLYRDSLHAGVPYGMHFDRGRLIGALCIDDRSGGLAITEKGCTAAELMVFARYIMFSEVYWHHAVRAATAMLQRAVFELQSQLDFPQMFRADDAAFVEILRQAAQHQAGDLVEGLFGVRRSLFKRVAQYTILEDSEVFQRLSQRPYDELVRCSVRLAEILRRATGEPLDAREVLIDAPPPALEIQFHIPVRYEQPRGWRWLGEVSPVVETLASRQFDNIVKRVRVFAHPARAAALRQVANFRELLLAATEDD